MESLVKIMAAVAVAVCWLFTQLQSVHGIGNAPYDLHCIGQDIFFTYHGRVGGAAPYDGEILSETKIFYKSGLYLTIEAISSTYQGMIEKISPSQRQFEFSNRHDITSQIKGNDHHATYEIDLKLMDSVTNEKLIIEKLRCESKEHVSPVP